MTLLLLGHWGPSSALHLMSRHLFASCVMQHEIPPQSDRFTSFRFKHKGTPRISHVCLANLLIVLCAVHKLLAQAPALHHASSELFVCHMCDPEDESCGYASESCCELEDDSAYQEEVSSLLPGTWLAERTGPTGSASWPQQEQRKVQALLQCLRQGETHDSWPDTDRSKAFQHILHKLESLPTRVTTWRNEALAAQLELSSDSAADAYKQALFEVSELVALVPLLFWYAGLRQMSSRISAGRLKGLAFFLAFEFDEASADLRVETQSSDTAGPHTMRRERARVTQHRVRSAVLLSETATGRMQLVSTSFCQPLMATDRVTAECILASVQQATQILGITGDLRNCF